MMTACRECSRRVSAEAPACPHCGVPTPGQGAAEREAAAQQSRRRLAMAAAIGGAVLVLVVVLVAVVGALTGGRTFDSPRQIADELGCTGFDDSSSVPGPDLPNMPATCDYAGGEVVLIVGRDADSRDRIARPGRADGVTVLTDGNWAVSSRDRAAVEAARKVLGGTIHGG